MPQFCSWCKRNSSFAGWGFQTCMYCIWPMYTHINIYVYIYFTNTDHGHIYIYILIYIFTCTHSSQPQERDVEITKLPGTFDLLLGLNRGPSTFYALRSDGTRRSVGDMIGTAEAAVTGSQQGSYPGSCFSTPSICQITFWNDDKSLHTQFPKNLVKGNLEKMVAKDFQSLRNVFFKGHFPLAYSNDRATSRFLVPPKKVLEFNFSHGNLRVHPQN